MDPAQHNLTAAEPPLAPSPRGGLLSVSAEQQRLWFLDQLLPREPARSSTAAARVDGADFAGLAAAVAALVRRHEILRSVIVADATGQPRLRIAPAASAEVALSIVDLTGLALTVSEAERARREASVSIYDLTRSPLFRPLLLRVADGAVLHFAFHPIVADPVSAAIALGEVVSHTAGPPPAVQHADLAVWQRQRFRGAALAAEVAFWREALAGAPAVVDLPADRPRPAVRSGRGFRVPIALSADVRGRLAAIAASSASPLLVAHAVLAALVARLSGLDDLVIGRTVSGRDRPELRTMIGPLANDIAVRTRFVDDPSLAALLPTVREATAAALAHARLPFAQLLEELRPEPSLHGTPIFQVAVEGSEPSAVATALPGPDLGAARYDVLLALTVQSKRSLRRTSSCRPTSSIARPAFAGPATTQPCSPRRSSSPRRRSPPCRSSPPPSATRSSSPGTRRTGSCRPTRPCTGRSRRRRCGHRGRSRSRPSRSVPATS
ncbi:MAG TPA: condensation domain-containing protein [Thermoanaerobaculia bacterium]